MRPTIKKLMKKYQNKEKLVCLTAYDAYFAHLVDDIVDIILVGDSLGMTVLGHNSTIPVTLDNIIHHTKAVVKGSDKAFVVSDMPFMANHISVEETCRNAQRIMQESSPQAIKIEGGSNVINHVKALTQGGIPVMGHLGILPQQYLIEGGYHIKGEKEEQKILAEAQVLQEAGIFALVLEGVKESVADKVTASLKIPTIGIGAGKNCDGQVQVMHDLLGMSQHQPKHAKIYDNIGERCRKALQNYADEVKNNSFPTKDHSF